MLVLFFNLVYKPYNPMALHENELFLCTTRNMHHSLQNHKARLEEERQVLSMHAHMRMHTAQEFPFMKANKSPSKGNFICAWHTSGFAQVNDLLDIKKWELQNPESHTRNLNTPQAWTEKKANRVSDLRLIILSRQKHPHNTMEVSSRKKGNRNEGKEEVVNDSRRPLWSEGDNCQCVT